MEIDMRNIALAVLLAFMGSVNAADSNQPASMTAAAVLDRVLRELQHDVKADISGYLFQAYVMANDKNEALYRIILGDNYDIKDWRRRVLVSEKSEREKIIAMEPDVAEEIAKEIEPYLMLHERGRKLTGDAVIKEAIRVTIVSDDVFSFTLTSLTDGTSVSFSGDNAKRFTRNFIQAEKDSNLWIARSAIDLVMKMQKNQSMLSAQRSIILNLKESATAAVLDRVRRKLQREMRADSSVYLLEAYVMADDNNDALYRIILGDNDDIKDWSRRVLVSEKSEREKIIAMEPAVAEEIAKEIEPYLMLHKRGRKLTGDAVIKEAIRVTIVSDDVFSFTLTSLTDGTSVSFSGDNAKRFTRNFMQAEKDSNSWIARSAIDLVMKMQKQESTLGIKKMIIPRLKEYATGQVTFLVAMRRGRNTSNTKAGENGYADNFRNLYYGELVTDARRHPLMFISKPFADAFLENPEAESKGAPTVSSVAEPGPSYPYYGYVFADDPNIKDWTAGFGLFAIPASRGSDSPLFWIGTSGEVYTRDALKFGERFYNPHPLDSSGIWKNMTNDGK